MQPPPAGPPGDSRAAAALIPARPRSCLIYRKARPAMTQVSSPDVWDFAERSVCTSAFTQPLPRAIPVLSGLGTNFQCCPCLTGHHHPAGRHLCHHRRGLARGAGHLFAADSCDTVGSGPPTPFKLTSAEALGHPHLYVKPNKPQVRPLTPKPLPSTCSSSAFPRLEVTALSSSRSDHKPPHHPCPPSPHAHHSQLLPIPLPLPRFHRKLTRGWKPPPHPHC